MDKAVIYPYSVEYAKQNSELDAWRESREANEACAKAIDKAVTDNNYELFHYDLKAAAKTVIEQFGFERVNWVLAGRIRQSFNDGRYSRDNHTWAGNIPVPNDRYGGFHMNTHPAILDGFVDIVRKDHAHMMAQTVGGYENSRRIAERNRLTSFDSDSGAFVLGKNVTRERLAERYNELMERKEARRASAVERLEAAKQAVKPSVPGASGKKKDLEVG